MAHKGVPTWDDTMRTLARHNFNAVLPYMATAGVAFYPSEVLPASPEVAEHGDFLAECVSAGKRHGVEVHARVLALFTYLARQAATDRYAAEDRYMRDENGRVVSRWLCPSKHVNRDLLADVVEEIAARYDVDGIQLDYFRYPWFRGCYCPSCKFAFERDLRLKVKRWPADVASGGALRMEYLAWRQANLTRLLRMMRQRALKARPGVRISAAVFPNWASHRYSFGQDWRTWVQTGLLDFVCPMDYVPTRARLAEWSEKQVRWVDYKAPVCIGIGVVLDDRTLDVDALIEQVRASREVGADGFVIFKYTEELAQRHLPALSAGLTATPARSTGLPAGVRVDVPSTQTVGGQRTALALNPVQVRVRVRPGAVASGTLSIFSVEGTFVRSLGTLDSRLGRAFRASASLPAGKYRPAVEGEVEGRPLVAWGPTVRVVSSDELARIRRKYRLPAADEPRTRVAVLADGRGSEPMYDVLAREEDLRPFVADAPTDEVLRSADVVIVPVLSGGPYALSADRVAALQRWVERDGGGLLMTHDAVGYGGFPALAPSICEGGLKRAKATQCTVAASGGVLDGFAKGAVLRHAYANHVVLKPGRDGRKVLASGSSPGGGPVLLAGHAGRGLAVACGIMLGVGADGAPTALSADERAILVGAVKWLASGRRGDV